MTKVEELRAIEAAKARYFRGVDTGIWSMTDRLFMPPGAPFAAMTGYGYYHESYEKTDRWKIKTLRIQRIRVEVSLRQ